MNDALYSNVKMTLQFGRCVCVMQKPSASMLMDVKREVAGSSETLVHTYTWTHDVTI